MQDASWLLKTEAAFKRVQRRKSSSTGRKPVKEGSKGEREAGETEQNLDWEMDGKSPCDSPFVTFYNNVIVLFLYFITGLGQSGPKGNSQTWHWIRLRSEMDRRQANGSKHWARFIWCFTLSRLVFDFFFVISCESVKGNIIRLLKKKKQ